MQGAEHRRPGTPRNPMCLAQSSDSSLEVTNHPQTKDREMGRLSWVTQVGPGASQGACKRDEEGQGRCERKQSSEVRGHTCGLWALEKEPPERTSPAHPPPTFISAP